MTTTKTLIEERAKQAWQYMLQPHDPMPSYAALDFVMEDSTDQKEVAKVELYAAAGGALEKLIPQFHSSDVLRSSVMGICSYLLEGNYVNANGYKGYFLSKYSQGLTVRRGPRQLSPKRREVVRWAPWKKEMVRVMDLCKEISEL